jgi:hypothetical protein
VSTCIAGAARRSAEKQAETQFLDIFSSLRAGDMHSGLHNAEKLSAE